MLHLLQSWAVGTTSSLSPNSPSSSSPISSSKPSRLTMSSSTSASATSRRVRIAVVGDVHDDWELGEDSKALEFLQPDLVLFTGDYGNENVKIVKSISDLQLPKAAILGNHDCWHTHKFSEKIPDKVRLQLECLGQQHVGYKCLDFPNLNLSVVGGRPFSCGGDGLFRPSLLSKWYGVNDMEASAKKIYDAAAGAPDEHFVILLAHNGPTGLGARRDDICGRDWVFTGGDHGDPDLAQAIAALQRDTKISIPLVVFGHMHKSLAYGNDTRKMLAVGNSQTLYLNGAVVPRVKHLKFRNPGNSSIEGGSQVQEVSSVLAASREFTVVDLVDGRVEKIAEVWVLVAGNRVELEHESVLFKNP